MVLLLVELELVGQEGVLEEWDVLLYFIAEEVLA